MEIEISCEYPEFMNMLEACLRVEIEKAKEIYSGLGSAINEYKVEVRTLAQTKKKLKDSLKNAQENVVALTAASIKQVKCYNQISNKIELMKLNLDDNYKVRKQELQEDENILKEYERTWQAYREKYENFPLAKIRKEAEIKLKKLQVNKMVLEFKLAEVHTIAKQNERITWLRMRGKIVELAREISNNRKLDETWRDLRENIASSRDQLNRIEAKLATQSKQQEEEKRTRALKLLEMPPPEIHFSHMRTIFERRPRSDFLGGWSKNYENAIDTLSMDTLMFDEKCLAEENPVQREPQTSVQSPEGEDDVYASQPVDGTSLCLDQEKPEVEQEDGASEMDGNAGPGPIDALDVEAEQRMDQELEHLVQPSGVSKDKQTGQCGEEHAEETDDPPVKRMRLIRDAGEVVASPAEIKRLEEKRCETSGSKCTPTIKKIETVRYNFSPIRRLERNKVQPAGHATGKINEENEPNPSSMFTPRHYDFSDSSVLSFCVDSNAANLKDQISFDGQSIRDFCECSNISNYNEDAVMQPVIESNADVPSTSRAQNFPQFDFSKILGRNPSGNNLF